MVIDAEGQRLLSRKVLNNESELLDLISEVMSLGGHGGELTWATDLNHGGAALLIALLSAHDHRLLYIPVALSNTHRASITRTARPTRRTRR